MKVLYIYSGTRKKLAGEPGQDYPDTSLYGENHLGAFGIEAEHKEFRDVPIVGVLPIPSFALRHALTTLYFSLFGDYDFIFGSSLLYGLFLKKLFGLKQKMVLLDISLGRTLSVNRKSRFKTRLIKSALREASTIICLSDYQQKFLEKELPEMKGKIRMVLLGVDVQYHQPVYENRQDYFLSTGRDNGRDYATVFKTAELMPERKFEIVASPRNVARLGEPPANVQIFFDLPPKRLYSKLLEAKALLLITHPDGYEDGSDCSGQTVLLEAMASGLSVIATKKQYLDNYVEEGKEALFVDSYDAESLRKTLATLSSERSLELAHSARKRVEQELSSEHMAEALSQIFLNLS